MKSVIVRGFGLVGMVFFSLYPFMLALTEFNYNNPLRNAHSPSMILTLTVIEGLVVLGCLSSFMLMRRLAEGRIQSMALTSFMSLLAVIGSASASLMCLLASQEDGSVWFIISLLLLPTPLMSLAIVGFSRCLGYPQLDQLDDKEQKLKDDRIFPGL